MFSEEFNFVRLTANYEIKEFDCVDDDLNEFLHQDSKNYLKELLSVTYLIESDKDLVAFFSIFNDKISVKDVGSNSKYERFREANFPNEKQNLKSYPAMKIGRLAVDKRFKGKGIGTEIIDFLKDTFTTNNRTGCRFITVDAYRQSLAFYEKMDFYYLTDEDESKDRRLMYFDLEPIYKAKQLAIGKGEIDQ